MSQREQILGGGWVEAGEIVVASDSGATRDLSWVKRSENGTVLLLSRRDGPSGSLYTIREFQEVPLGWRYVAEGETLELLGSRVGAERKMYDFSELLEGSIADVCCRYAISALKEIEARQRR